MKTKFAFTFFALLASTLGRSLLAGDSDASSPASRLLPKAPTPACCAAVKKESCCDELPAGAPLTARSLYQLDAKWSDDAGRPVKLVAFRGQPVVAAMFFASCEYACPVLVNDMQRLRAALPAEVREKTRFLLVSFDTARDTSAVLAAYRAKASLDAAWTLLRGDATDVQDLAMLLGVKYKQDARGQFSHSNLITVLNPGGEIVHQHPGLQGDVGAAVKAVTALVPAAK